MIISDTVSVAVLEQVIVRLSLLHRAMLTTRFHVDRRVYAIAIDGAGSDVSPTSIMSGNTDRRSSSGR